MAMCLEFVHFVGFVGQDMSPMAHLQADRMLMHIPSLVDYIGGELSSTRRALLSDRVHKRQDTLVERA